MADYKICKICGSKYNSEIANGGKCPMCSQKFSCKPTLEKDKKKKKKLINYKTNLIHNMLL